jgi:hypothetical protein
MAPATKVPSKPIKIDEYIQFLHDSLWTPVDLLNTPARDLTRLEAVQVITWLLAWGKLTIRNRDALFEVKPDDTIGPITPVPQVALSPTKIEGVEFRYLSAIDGRGFKKSVHQNMDNLDPRMVVFLWKLCKMLKLDYGANVIYHIGFAFAAERTDCHGQGRALDFAGAAGDDFDVTIGYDWSNQPITLIKDYNDPKTRKVIPKGTKLDKWPPAPFRDVYYRLDPSLNPNLDPSRGQYDLAGDLFFEVYEMAADECRDTDVAADSPTSIGAKSSYILHPDYAHSEPGTPHGREAHWQHIHIQIGPTETDNSPH